MQRTFNSIFFSALPLATLGYSISLPVQAQVIPDGTTTTTVNQDGDNFVIDQGDRVGDNLFHSFNEFSVPTLGSAAFNNAGDIANIFSRVTGSNISSIDGLLSANGAANLYLINPNGIIFGENARLDLGGSFFASTADSLLFEGDTEFNASNPQAAPLLEVNIPIGARFRDNPEDITIEKQPPGSADFDPAPSFDDNFFGLRVPDGKSFVLAGGEITSNGAGIISFGGRIELGAVEQAGTLGLNLNSDNISLVFPENLQRADVSLINGSGFLVSGNGGGDLTITANNLNISEGSNLSAGIFNGLGSPDAQAGDIRLNATNNVAIDNSFVLNQVSENAIGNSGNLFIDTQNLLITNGGQTGVLTFGTGDTGDLTIDASELIQLDSGDTGSLTGIFAQILQNGVGNVGNTSIETKNLNISNNSRIGTNTFGQGDAGDLNLQTQVLNISGGAQITGSTFGQGNGGNLSIVASDIEINGGENVLFTTLTSSVDQQATGTGGNITIGSEQIPVENLTVTNGGQIQASIFGQGDGGNININTGSLNLNNGASIDASTFSQGNAGSVNILARDFVSLDDGSGNTFIANNVGEGGRGSSRGVNMTTGSLFVNNGAQIQSLIEGEGDSGTIVINASDTISFDGRDANNFASGAFSNVDFGAVGISGGVNITTGSLSVNNSAQIQSQVEGQGNSGKIIINAQDTVSFDGRDSTDISPSAAFSRVIEGGSGSSGGIEINANSLSITNRAQLSSTLAGVGEVGDIIINTNEEVLLSNSIIISEVSDQGGVGDGGDINITTGSLLLQDGSSLLADTENQGNAGDINIEASDRIILEGVGIAAESNSNDIVPSQISTTAESDAIGKSGDIDISANNLFIDEGFIASSTSSSEEVTAGNLFVDTNSLDLDSGSILSSAVFGQGGNLELTVTEDLTFRNSSLISAEAFNNAVGGNVTINADNGFLLAFPDQNNDILANASQGNGGNIDISTQAIFGLEERRSTPPNQTNDIDASSEFGLQGDFSLNTPDFDPTTGLINLPASVGDASDRISQNLCEQGVGSEFIVTGKGGIPPNPADSLKQ